MGVKKSEAVQSSPSKNNEITPAIERYRNISRIHIESFDTFLDEYLPKIVENLPKITVDPIWYSKGPRPTPADALYRYKNLQYWISDVKIGKPVNIHKAHPVPLYPGDCRETHTTYAAPITIYVQKQIVNHTLPSAPMEVHAGWLPVMLRTKACNLHNLPPSALPSKKEDELEPGGIFILNGIEKLIRLIINPRGNFPMAVQRPTYAKRGPMYSNTGVYLRGIRPDGTSTANILHYINDGSFAVRLLINRKEYHVPLLPLILSLLPLDKTQLLELLLNGDWSDEWTLSRLEAQLADLNNLVQDPWGNPLVSQSLYKTYVASLIAYPLREQLDVYATPEEVFDRAVKDFLLVHLTSNEAKAHCLGVMFRKLVATVTKKTLSDNQDSFSHHEVATPGQLYATIVRDGLYECLLAVRKHLERECYMAKQKGEANEQEAVESVLLNDNIFRKAFSRESDIGRRLNYFIATGNIRTRTADLLQVSGYTVVAERINIYRYISHFRSVHRGAYFAEMKTTSVRRLLPETWGFLCPVHTPDGSPCGLLLHLAKETRATVKPVEGELREIVREIVRGEKGVKILQTMGGKGCVIREANGYVQQSYPLMVDGEVIGYVNSDCIEDISALLRQKKIQGEVSEEVEIVAIKADTLAYPGVYLASHPGRLIRPVFNLQAERIEYIGAMEQPWLNIAVSHSDIVDSQKYKALTDLMHSVSWEHMVGTQNGVHSALTDRVDSSLPLVENVPVDYTHREISKNSFLSILGSLTPFCHHNQSPRNMYQCQMLKQTMAIPFMNLPFRTDNKAYRLQTPQIPLVRTEDFEGFGFENYPSGTNAVIAVISYTGFDMEDAMILNKSSLERGMFHGSVYKTKVIDAAPNADKISSKDAALYRFTNFDSQGNRECPDLEDDGTPYIGSKVKNGSVIARVRHGETGQVSKLLYKDEEEAYVEKVGVARPPRECSDLMQRVKNNLDPVGERLLLTLRLNRNPIIGDKFSSRHGQKGILSLLLPHVDMPFTASGIVPDICFNPHGLPSRMTVGKLLEIISAKACAIEGRKGQLASAFGGDGGNSFENFGEILKKNGYSFYGTETLYNGQTGVPMQAEIFMGICYYQRLRHMVSDKAQVRANGPIDSITRQPLKGRKNHGGVRFGEMERDSLISHGTAFLIQDRLLNCSDVHNGQICPACGNILSCYVQKTVGGGNVPNGAREVTCVACQVKCVNVKLPYVYRYLCNELIGMNVAIRLEVTQSDGNPTKYHLQNIPAY